MLAFFGEMIGRLIEKFLGWADRHENRAIYPSAWEALKMEKSSETSRKENSLEYMRNRIRIERLQMAERLRDMFEAVDKMDEQEFIDIMSTLNSDGVVAASIIEKFRKYKGL